MHVYLLPQLLTSAIHLYLPPYFWHQPHTHITLLLTSTTHDVSSTLLLTSTIPVYIFPYSWLLPYLCICCPILDIYHTYVSVTIILDIYHITLFLTSTIHIYVTYSWHLPYTCTYYPILDIYHTYVSITLFLTFNIHMYLLLYTWHPPCTHIYYPTQDIYHTHIYIYYSTLDIYCTQVSTTIFLTNIIQMYTYTQGMSCNRQSSPNHEQTQKQNRSNWSTTMTATTTENQTTCKFKEENLSKECAHVTLVELCADNQGMAQHQLTAQTTKSQAKLQVFVSHSSYAYSHLLFRFPTQVSCK